RLHLRPESVSAAVVSMPQPALFERRWQRGKWERELSLHLTPEWLKAHASVCGLSGPSLNVTLGSGLPVPVRGGDVCVVPWTPSPHALALAEQLILDADASASPLMRLRQAGRALEIFYEALAKREAPTLTEATGLRLRDHERMVRLRDFLDDEIRQPYLQALTIEALGQRFGLSASALQRQFRQAFSCSINEYRRNMRLLQARAELERGSTIAAAAERAGYGSAANFATAFRRQFGLSPRAVRGRVCIRRVPPSHVPCTRKERRTMSHSERAPHLAGLRLALTSFTIALPTAGVATGASAQPIGPTTLSPVVVTASGVEQQVKDAPASMTVISRDDI